MAKVIIGIHGLANKPKKDDLRDGWCTAIVEGLQKNAGISEPTINFVMVDYADVYYAGKRLTPEANEEPYKAAKDGALKRYDERFWEFVGGKVEEVVGEKVDKAKEKLGWTTDVIDKALTKVLKDLGLYYTDPTKREAIQATLRDTLNEHKNNEVMLIAHSMGTIVAYDVLREIGRENRGVAVSHLVTIGSPLGLAHVKRKIQLESPNSRLRTPSIVTRSWVNYADRRDYVALDSHLGDDYKANSGNVRVQDDRVINDYPNNAHKSYGYLRTPELSEHIAAFL